MKAYIYNKSLFNNIFNNNWVLFQATDKKSPYLRKIMRNILGRFTETEVIENASKLEDLVNQNTHMDKEQKIFICEDEDESENFDIHVLRMKKEAILGMMKDDAPVHVYDISQNRLIRVSLYEGYDIRLLNSLNIKMNEKDLPVSIVQAIVDPLLLVIADCPMGAIEDSVKDELLRIGAGIEMKKAEIFIKTNIEAIGGLL